MEQNERHGQYLRLLGYAAIWTAISGFVLSWGKYSQLSEYIVIIFTILYLCGVLWAYRRTPRRAVLLRFTTVLARRNVALLIGALVVVYSTIELFLAGEALGLYVAGFHAVTPFRVIIDAIIGTVGLSEGLTLLVLLGFWLGTEQAFRVANR